MKKLILVTFIIATLMSTSVFAQTSLTEVTGSIEASILDVDIPTVASFTINPNEPDFVSPDLIITNNSTMPVTLSLTGFDNKVDSENQFTEVGANEKDWDNLGINESKHYIYLAIGAKDSYEEGYIINKEWLNDVSALTVQSSTIECASIAPGRNVTLNFRANYGRAYEEAFTTTYDLIFLISIME